MLKNGVIIHVVNFVCDKNLMLIGKKFSLKAAFYIKPCNFKGSWSI